MRRAQTSMRHRGIPTSWLLSFVCLALINVTSINCYVAVSITYTPRARGLSCPMQVLAPHTMLEDGHARLVCGYRGRKWGTTALDDAERGFEMVCRCSWCVSSERKRLAVETPAEKAVDPLCKRYGVRMIVVDRPGIGATPVVPLAERVEVSCRELCDRAGKAF